MVADGPVCGRPVKFYRLARPRTDMAPACCRPAGHKGKHLSLAAVERNRERRRAWGKQRRAGMSEPGDRTGSC